MSGNNLLTGADYAVFGATLGISAVIGVFFAIKDRKSKSGTENYLLGGRKMGMIPVSLSLTVSFMSAITVLGTPAEVYRFGTMYWWFLASLLIVAIITSEIYIPLFYNMKISSTYEYLERRFNKSVRVMGTLTFILEHIIYIGIVIYAPALALNQAAGMDLWTAVLSTGIVCTFYTTLGGIKAVIWTDVFQAVVMVIGFLCIIIKGSADLGGFDKAWQTCEENGRIDFIHFETDVHYRHTVWSILVGGTFMWLGIYGVSQSQVQRYLCCKSVKQAKGALFLNWVGLCVIISLSMLNGIVMYAYYHGCDPLSTGDVGAADQLIPYLSLDLFQSYPGVTGLVVSCVFSGSLSTVSSGINAMACVTLEDFVKPHTNWNETKYTLFSKGSVIIFGMLCIAMAWVASQLGGVLEAALSIFGIVGGPLVGLFTLGIMFPFANSIGAVTGLISGIIFTIWVYVGSKAYPQLTNEYLRVMPLYTDQCEAEVINISNSTEATITVSNATIDPTTHLTTPGPYPAIATNLYAISYAYYSCLGFSATIGIGLIMSLLTCGWRQRKTVNPKLLFPFFDHWMFKWLPKSFREMARCGGGSEYEDSDGEWDGKNGVSNPNLNLNESNTFPVKQKKVQIDQQANQQIQLTAL